jgi:hypothetical protein
VSLLDRFRKFFSPKRTPANDPPSRIATALHGLFVSHGVDTKIRGEDVVLADGRLPISGRIVKVVPHPNSVHVQLDVSVVLDDGRTLIESFANSGKDEAAATDEALRAFIQSSFHVIFKALHFPADPHMESKEWIIGGTSRRVVDSEAIIRGGDADAGRAALPCLVTFEDRLAELDVPKGVHWLRMYYAQLDGKALGGEVLLDNETWEGPQDEWMALSWPPAKGFYSLRRFVIIQDVG